MTSSELQQYLITVNDLYANLRYIYHPWLLYEDYLDSGAVSGTYPGVNAANAVNSELGRPRLILLKISWNIYLHLGLSGLRL